MSQIVHVTRINVPPTTDLVPLEFQFPSIAFILRWVLTPGKYGEVPRLLVWLAFLGPALYLRIWSLPEEQRGINRPLPPRAVCDKNHAVRRGLELPLEDRV